MNKNFNNEKLDIIIPITTEADLLDPKEVIRTIRFQKENYGFTRFALSSPAKGYRKTEMPSLSHYEKLAKEFLAVKEAVEKDGIECGWWNQLTIKSGASDEHSRMIRFDGTETPFSSCPLDPAFQKAFAEANATFAEIAKPAFIILEDDYSVAASAGGRWCGCYCDRHLDAFAKITGKRYNREELVGIFEQETAESFELFRKWRDLMGESMVALSEAVRTEVDKKSPEIPIGSMQPGSCDADGGNSTEKIARALAGKNHTPFCRIHGTRYCTSEDTKDLTNTLFHALYSKQHISGDFIFYHESDTFPHTLFYMSASKMRAYMSAVYSYGFDGSTFQTAQILDDMNEEPAYGLMYKKERDRFNEVHRIAKQCDLQGAELDYDPFWNTAEPHPIVSFWAEPLSLFGIPFTTTQSDVAFWDIRQAMHKDHDEVLKALSKGLFLDGAAAKALCERGYGKYIGVEVGENVAQGRMKYDLDAREIIKPPFDTFSKGKNMPAAHMFSNGKSGMLLELKVTDPSTEIITEEYSFQRELNSVAMTRFQNELGGKIVVMGTTLERNRSQNLFNYRRQKLLHELLKWCSDSYIYTKDRANIHTIVNKSRNQTEFKGMITLINLGDDTLESAALHIPPKWQDAKEFLLLDQKGNWVQGNTEFTGNQLIIREPFNHCDPIYILVK